MIQRALGVTPDGAIGAITLKAIQEADGKELLEKFSHSKEAFYKALPTFETYGKGWLRRVADVKTSASTMIG
jgi:lysozyme family protein